MKVVGCQPYAPAAFTPELTWYSFLEAESTPGDMELSDATEKATVTLGIFFFLFSLYYAKKYRLIFLLAYWPLYCLPGHMCIRY
jgi:hypothetical protein